MSARAAALLLLTAACSGGHRYGVPRTLPPGEMAHHFSVDVGEHWYGVGCDDALPSNCGSESTIAPVPSYALRYGLADRLELGFAASLALSVEADLKVQMLRSTVFDLSIAPTIGLMRLPLRYAHDVGDRPTILASLPLLLGVRVGEVTIVPAGMVGSVRNVAGSSAVWATALTTFFPVSSDLQLGPGVTLFYLPDADEDVQLLGGLTLALGGPR